MTNTELTLDQLQTINGGAAFIRPNCRRSYSKPSGTPRDRIGGKSGPGGTSF
jgi:hypothetical protein